MADFAKLDIRARYSEVSDYSTTQIDSGTAIAPAWTPTEHAGLQKLIAATGGSTWDAAHLPSPSVLLVHNTDSTNFVTVTWTDSATNANTQKVPAGTTLMIPDFNPATDPTLTADTSDVTCLLAAWG